jgi:hypothetical protein
LSSNLSAYILGTICVLNQPCIFAFLLDINLSECRTSQLCEFGVLEYDCGRVLVTKRICSCVTRFEGVREFSRGVAVQNSRRMSLGACISVAILNLEESCIAHVSVDSEGPFMTFGNVIPDCFLCPMKLVRSL